MVPSYCHLRQSIDSELSDIMLGQQAYGISITEITRTIFPARGHNS